MCPDAAVQEAAADAQAAVRQREAERQEQRRAARRDLRRLPRSLGRLLDSRNAYVRQAVLDIIARDIGQVARRRGLLKTTGSVCPAGLIYQFRRAYAWLSAAEAVPERIWDAVVAELAADPNYRCRVRRLVRAEERKAHVGAVTSYDPQQRFRRMKCIEIPRSGLWSAQADLGLGSSSFLEAMPDALAIALAQRILDRARGCDIDDDVASFDDTQPTPQRVFVWGAGPSTVLRAINVVFGEAVPFIIHEADAVQMAARSTEPPAKDRDDEVDPDEPDPPPEPQRVHRHDQWPFPPHGLSQSAFDLVVVHAPAPGEGVACQYRHIYGTQIEEARSEKDIGRLGPRKWMRDLETVVRSTPILLAEGGEAAFYLPLGVRLRDGYRDEPTLLDPLAAWLSESGLTVTHDLIVVEKDPRAQPFVARKRCPWRLILARKASEASHA